jgi:hypothetical protein
MRSTFPTYAFDSLSISAVARSVLNSPPRCCGEDQCLKPVARLTKSKVFGFPEPLLPFRPFSLQDHRPIQFHLRGLPFAKRPISVRSPTALSIRITAVLDLAISGSSRFPCLNFPSKTRLALLVSVELWVSGFSIEPPTQTSWGLTPSDLFSCST